MLVLLHNLNGSPAERRRSRACTAPGVGLDPTCSVPETSMSNPRIRGRGFRFMARWRSQGGCSGRPAIDNRQVISRYLLQMMIPNNPDPDSGTRRATPSGRRAYQFAAPSLDLVHQNQHQFDSILWMVNGRSAGAEQRATPASASAPVMESLSPFVPQL